MQNMSNYAIILLRFAVFNLNKINTAFFLVGGSMFEHDLQLGNYNCIFIKETDYERIKTLIKENLIGLCWGKENTECFDIKDVINEFIERFSKKSIEQQYGYIGEFIYYLYILQNDKILKPLSIFFNQEERSFKKGFDLLGFDGENMWYSEVKSGNSSGKDIDSYNLERLSTAYNDIKDKLKIRNRNTNYWDTAKSNLCKIENSKDERSRLSKILDDDKKIEFIKNKIITSVIFDKSDLLLDNNKVKDKYDRLKCLEKNITIICIRKKTIEKVISILKEVQKENE